jgi:hypothetical protein
MDVMIILNIIHFDFDDLYDTAFITIQCVV